MVPSICYENSPLVAIEAFRQRTPIIVRNLGGMPEIIEESRGGFVYNTEAELVAAMDKLVQDPQRRRELGLSGYSAYRKKWTPEPHLDRYFELIFDIAARRNGFRGHEVAKRTFIKAGQAGAESLSVDSV